MGRKWWLRLLASCAVGILAVTPLVIDFRLWLSEQERHLGPPEHYTVPHWLGTIDQYVETPGVLVQFLLSPGTFSFAGLRMRELAITNAVFYGAVTWWVLSWLDRRRKRRQKSAATGIGK